MEEETKEITAEISGGHTDSFEFVIKNGKVTVLSLVQPDPENPGKLFIPLPPPEMKEEIARQLKRRNIRNASGTLTPLAGTEWQLDYWCEDVVDDRT